MRLRDPLSGNTLHPPRRIHRLAAALLVVTAGALGMPAVAHADAPASYSAGADWT